jgi:hypothetical protein
MFSFSLFVNLQTYKMKLIILKFHIFYTYFTIKKILEVKKNKTKILNKSESFITWQGSFENKTKQLKLQDKENKPKRACPPTDEEINILYIRNVLGSHTPQSLLNTLIWLNNSVQFEHQTLKLLHIFYYKISSY